MNFLAHIYLSGDNDLLKIGNFIADQIKGNKYLEFEQEIQNGIQLHREIDSYTDAHPIFRKSKRKLVPEYNHYSGVIVDVFYDHFLAKNWLLYSDIPLEAYVNHFYSLLEKNKKNLPPRIQNLLPIMIADNWLVSYKTIEGIHEILSKMDRRTQNISKMKFSTKDLKLNYTDFEIEFTLFFKEIQLHVHNYRKAKGI